MNHALHHRRLWSLDSLSGADLLALLDMAQHLRRGCARARPLQGRNLALLSAHPGDAGSQRLEQAATALGAQVARIRPERARGDDDAPATARVLGRLYDAVDCEGLDDGFVEQIERSAGVPVFNGLGSDGHPVRVLAVLADLRERTGRPLQGLSVKLVGDAQTPFARALREVAERVGLRLQPGGADGDTTDAVIDTEAADTRDPQPLLQALLLSTMT